MTLADPYRRAALLAVRHVVRHSGNPAVIANLDGELEAIAMRSNGEWKPTRHEIEIARSRVLEIVDEMEARRTEDMRKTASNHLALPFDDTYTGYAYCECLDCFEVVMICESDKGSAYCDDCTACGCEDSVNGCVCEIPF